MYLQKILSITCLFLIGAITPILAQDIKGNVPDKEQEIFTVVEQPPQYPGGLPALSAYLSANLTYPKKAAKKNIQGTVYVNFVVNSVGKVSEVKVLQGIGYGCDEEAARVVKKMSDWVPGTQGGRNVNVRYNLPIKFKLKN